MGFLTEEIDQFTGSTETEESAAPSASIDKIASSPSGSELDTFLNNTDPQNGPDQPDNEGGNATQDDGEESPVPTADKVNNKDTEIGPALFKEGAKAADWLAGSTDEAVARSTDSKKGGGLWTGFDQSTRATGEAVFDNSALSVQDLAREGIEQTTGVESENQGEAAKDLATGFKQFSKNAVEGTPLAEKVNIAGHEVSGAGIASGAFDTFVKPLGTGVLTATTGIDPDTGSEEGTVSGEEAADIALTAATGGTGKAAASALKSSDEAGAILSKLISGGDDAASASTSAGDEAASATTNSGTSDLSTDWLGRLTENGTAASDEASKTGAAADTASNVADRIGSFLSKVSDEGLSGSDEAASGTDDAASIADDTAAAGDEATSGADDAASSGDDALDLSTTGAKASDEGGLLSRLGTGTKALVGGTAATAGGVTIFAALKSQDRIEMANGDTLVKEDVLPPNKRDKNGAIAYRVIRPDGTEAGYTVLLGFKGRNAVILGPNGNPTKSKVALQTWKDAAQRTNSAGNGGAA